MNATRPSDPRSAFTVLGHRGAKGHAPENTLVSFEKAIALGATMVELDIHLSKDGELIVMHDADVRRTTNGSGLIADLTLAEIKRLDAGAWFGPEFAGQKVPTLAEVIGLIKGRMLLNIEIKKGAARYDGIAARMVETLLEHDFVDDVVVSSFEREYLRETRQALDRVQTALLYQKPQENVCQEAVDEGWTAIHPNLKLVDQALVEDAHARCLGVRAWNPNEVELMIPLLDLGVDGIGTDFPERLRELALARGLLA